MKLFSWSTYRNIRYRLSNFSIVILVVIIAVYIYIQLSLFLTKSQIAKQEIILQQKNQELESLLSAEWLSTLEAARYLQENVVQMPRSKHIPKVIGIVDSLQSLDWGDGGSIKLSDFRVSLDKISLHGTVSNLLLLYYSAPERGFMSLLDRFSKLDFIKDMRIQNYTKWADGTYEFVLQANVINDDSTTK